MKILTKIHLFLIVLFFVANTVTAQQTVKQTKEAEKTAALKSKIDGQKYTFQATYALPMHGGQKYLTSEYDLRITKDSVIAFLPYFGRVYMSAPITTEENGIMFTSTDFAYKVSPLKKGGWSILITPDNVKYISKMQLDVFTNGAATLYVSSNYRDPINFNGNIK